MPRKRRKTRQCGGMAQAAHGCAALGRRRQDAAAGRCAIPPHCRGSRRSQPNPTTSLLLLLLRFLPFTWEKNQKKRRPVQDTDRRAAGEGKTAGFERYSALGTEPSVVMRSLISSLTIGT